MKRHLAAIAVVAIAAGSVAIAVAPGASAATRAPIRTYHYTQNYNLTGLGRAAGWYDHFSSKQVVDLSGRPAVSQVAHEKYFNSHDKLVVASSSDYLVNGLFYAENDGATTWTVTRESAAQMKDISLVLDPYDSVAEFDALAGVRLVGKGHYQVTGTPAQVASFLGYEYNLTVK